MTGSGKNAPACTTSPTSALMTAVGGTPPRWTTTGPMTSGLPATSSPPGRNASGTTATTALGMTATATGSGRIAPNSTTRATTALMTAVGGTLQASMTTGPMTGGSPATSSTTNGRGAEQSAWPEKGGQPGQLPAIGYAASVARLSGLSSLGLINFIKVTNLHISLALHLHLSTLYFILSYLLCIA